MNKTTATENEVKETLEAAEAHSGPARPRDDLRSAGRRAKIVCTLGPSSNTEAMVRELMRAGMDVVRHPDPP